jgi:flagellar motor switch protein FliM
MPDSANNEFLSQEEVDALLTGVTGDDEEVSIAETSGEVRAYDLTSNERVVRGKMPALDLINERFVRLLRTGLLNFMGHAPQVTCAPVRTIKYAEFTSGLPQPLSLNVAQIKPLRGNALFVFDPTLVYLVVDNLFGGNGRFQARPETRELTSTEQRISQRLLYVVFDELQKAWKDVHPLAFELVRSDTNLQFITVAAPSDMVVVSSFTIELGAVSGTLHVCIPYGALEPIRPVLQGAGEKSDVLEPDRHWMRMLSRQVQSAEVELVAELVNVSVTVKQLMTMTVGDIISVDMPPLVTAQVDGVPIFDCRYGALNGQYAIRIESVLTPDRDSVAGEQYA